MNVEKANLVIFIGDDSSLGRGIGTEAAKLMIHYGFNELGLHKIFLRVLADNERAIKSYEKVGFTKEGFFRDEVYINGTYHDLIYMAIINPLNNK